MIDLHVTIIAGLIVALTMGLSGWVVYRRTGSVFAAWLGGSFGSVLGTILSFLFVAGVMLK